MIEHIQTQETTNQVLNNIAARLDDEQKAEHAAPDLTTDSRLKSAKQPRSNTTRDAVPISSDIDGCAALADGASVSGGGRIVWPHEAGDSS